MWFKRKQRNRRLGGGHVLDVKLRSDRARATRLRLQALAFAMTFGTFFGLYVLWRSGQWALDRFVYQNRTFAIEQVDVQTDGVIDPGQLRRWAGVKPGGNLLALDLADVKRNLELDSRIASVSVERILPRTLRIQVSEREPIAQVNVLRAEPGGTLAGSVMQLDAQGYVMEPLDPRQRLTPLNQVADQLPVLAGLNPLDLNPGRRLETPQVLAALDLLQQFDQSPMAGLVDLEHIDVSVPDVLVVRTGQGSEITFGLRDLDRQLRRWRAIFEYGQTQHKAVASLDLAVSQNSPVKWFDADAASSSAPKAPKTPRFKKKNV